jgi:hypothetical protein
MTTRLAKASSRRKSTNLTIQGRSLISGMPGAGVKGILIGTTLSTMTVAWHGSPRSRSLLLGARLGLFQYRQYLAVAKS